MSRTHGQDHDDHDGLDCVETYVTNMHETQRFPEKLSCYFLAALT